jgi:glutamate carboxypeptidase
MAADPWVTDRAAELAATAEEELAALVAVSSPSGDVEGAEAAARVAIELLPGTAEVERPRCSSPEHAPDVLASVRGTGTGRLLLLGHLDTVVAHDAHRPLRREGDRLLGSGAVDMKGGDALALGVMRTLAREPERFAEVALLLVVDEEWRTHEFVHATRFAGWDACLCFEAGERGPDGQEGVVVRRKAAGTLRVEAEGRAAHSGSAPDRGENALLGLAEAARVVAACHDPHGPDRLSAVPTILRSGQAFNVVPDAGELLCDLRAERLAAFEPVLAALPGQVGGVRLEGRLIRRWPAMDTSEQAAPILAAGTERLGRPIVGVARGGASDASHLAGTVPLTIDGLGPRGGAAHNPGEFVHAPSLRERAEVALALAVTVLDGEGEGENRGRSSRGLT